MKVRSRLYILLVWIIFAVFIVISGTWIETHIVKDGAFFGNKFFGSSFFLFFSAVNINVILLLLFVFLTFRSGVKLIVDNSHGAFGSKLNTKLVTAFLFFALLPTVVLLYVSTKFVNTNFEKLLPSNFVEATEETLNSEATYQNQILSLFSSQNPTKDNLTTFDFVRELKKEKYLYLSEKDQKNSNKIENIIEEKKYDIGAKASWFEFDKERMILIKANSTYIFGIISPKMLHPQWLLLKSEYPESHSAAKILKLSYYVMLGVITLLIIFSATWLGFTIAREITVPMQILSKATESLAHGNYSVKIDDIVSDDEMGKLALSFRSMVSDLKIEKERADIFSAELKRKADELLIKSEYNEILLRNINAAVIALDEELNIETWNNRAENLFNFKEYEVLGKKIYDIVNINFYEKALLNPLSELSNAAHKRIAIEWAGKIFEVEYQLQILLSGLVSSRGKIFKIIFINDITELAKVQRMVAWRDVARRVAHEIKNPLTPIKLGAQRIEKRFSQHFKGDEKDIFQETVKIILQSSESIRILVDEFIKFSRMPHSYLEEGNIVETVYMAMRGFVGNQENVPMVFEANINSNHILLRNEERIANLPIIHSKFDRDQIVRLFVNLISNAVTVSSEEKSPVVISITSKPHQTFVKIQVKDNGAGLSNEVLSKLFEPYFSTKKTGTGLGLVIAKQIVDEHNGKIYVEENLPKGTVFTVEIPKQGSQFE
ncbi:ATP-binding protein [Pigmentibacter sp. JX0631]|uniref:sensor histidine kinase n=1 Tax=Pigmentibacter sp. JX0631 TaxID=2976982 RepID=UPI002469A241|nr:ATP-binding protein [Pigmentibacter sp. JX0631]WGL61486.1 ATP-binding protein [Pigmentibacter sp. JX0631]